MRLTEDRYKMYTKNQGGARGSEWGRGLWRATPWAVNQQTVAVHDVVLMGTAFVADVMMLQPFVALLVLL